MNRSSIFLFAALLLVTFLSAEARFNKRADCGTNALLVDPYFKLTSDWQTSDLCTYDSLTQSRSCPLPPQTFSPESGWRGSGSLVASNRGREKSDGRYSVQLAGNGATGSIESDFTFPTGSPRCTLRWQDFTLQDIAYEYQVDLIDSEGNSIGGPFPSAHSTDDENACDFSGCNIDARSILDWTLPAQGKYTVRFTGLHEGDVGAFVTDVCVACLPPSPSPSASISVSASPSTSRSVSPSPSASPSSPPVCVPSPSPEPECPEPEPECPEDPCHNDDDDNITININFTCGGNKC